MKRIKKALLLTLCLVLLLPVQVLAAGSVTLFSSNPSPKVGDSFTVTVKSTESAQIKVSYNSQILELSGADATGTSTSNSFTYTAGEAKLTFKAKAAGTSGVIVESPTVTGASFNVVVSGQEAANTETAPEPSQEPAQEPQTTETTENQSNQTVPEGSDFAVDGIGYVLSERYKDNEIPAGFTEVRLNINGKSVRELTNGVLTIVYLKPADNIQGSGEFYIYNQDSGTVSKMMLLGALDNYVILETPENFFTEALEESELNTGEKVVPAYRISGSDSEFFYVYGTNPQGAKGWYAYDSLTGNMSRADVLSLSMIDYTKEVTPVPEDTLEDEPEEEKQGFFDKISTKINDFADSIGFDLSGLDIKLVLMIAAGVLGLIIIIVIIVNIIRGRDDYYDDEYYDDEEGEGSDGPATEALDNTEKEESLIDDLLTKASDKDKKDVDIINLDDL